MNGGYLSWRDSVDRELMDTLNELVEKYNRYLEETQGNNQLDIHKDLQAIVDKLKQVLPEHA